MNNQLKLIDVVPREQQITTKDEFLQSVGDSILQDRIKEFGPERLLLSDCVEALTGIPGEKARRFLKEFGVVQLPKVCGALDITEEQRVKLLLLYESCRRIGTEKMGKIIKVTSPEDAVAIFRNKLSYYENERFYVAFLNARNILIKMEMLAVGSITEVVASPALILKRSVCLGSSSILLGHNHPSGLISASQQDRVLTDKVKSMLSLANISLIDHVIISDNDYLSFKQEGYL